MQEAKEANPHAITQHWRVLWLELQRTIAQAQPLNRLLQVIVIFVGHREKARIDEGLDLFVAREGLDGYRCHI